MLFVKNWYLYLVEKVRNYIQFLRSFFFIHAWRYNIRSVHCLRGVKGSPSLSWSQPHRRWPQQGRRAWCLKTCCRILYIYFIEDCVIASLVCHGLCLCPHLLAEEGEVAVAAHADVEDLVAVAHLVREKEVDNIIGTRVCMGCIVSLKWLNRYFDV